MTLFKAKQELETQVSTLTAQLADVNKQLTEANNQIKNLEAKATGISQEEHQKVLDENTLLQQKVTSLETDLKAEKDNTEKFSEKVQMKVVEELAKAGSPQVKNCIPTQIHPSQVDNDKVRKSSDGRYTYIRLN